MAGTPGVRPGELSPNTVLSSYALSYGNSLGGYIADQVAPVATVAFETGKFYIWDAETQFAEIGSGLRAAGDASQEIRFSKTDGTYSAKEYGHHIVIPDRSKKNYAGPLDYQTMMTQMLVRKNLDAREIRVAAAWAAASNGTTLSGTSQWSHASSKPFTAIETGIAAFIGQCGLAPNTFIVPLDVALKLRNHANFVARYSYFKDTVESIELPPTIFGMKVIVPKTMKATSKLGAATLTLGNAWGKHAYLAYIDPNPTPFSLNAVTSFRVEGDSVYTWYENARRGDIVEVSMIEDVKIVSQGCIYKFTDAVA